MARESGLRPSGRLPAVTGSTAAALVAVLFGFPNLTRAAASSGELIYNFTYSATQDVTARDAASDVEPSAAGGNAPSGINNAQTPMVNGNSVSGMSNYGGTLTDKGTITVDIVKKQPDGTMAVMISEQGENVRRAPPAECVVGDDTHVICDPNKTVYTEEYTILRFLGANFVDPKELDASKHWSIAQISGDGTDVHADYSINRNNSGMMQIGEKRTVKELGAGHLTTNIEANIGYDLSRLVPTSVQEYATQHADAGLKGNSSTTYQTTLNLVSDTAAKQ
jgi:hypothetical protein